MGQGRRVLRHQARLNDDALHNAHRDSMSEHRQGTSADRRSASAAPSRPQPPRQQQRLDPDGWTEVPADERGDAIVAAMGLGGVDYMFFNSGSEIMFMQEAIAKANALGRPAPKLVMMTHEYPTLNAALGYAAVDRAAWRRPRCMSMSARSTTAAPSIPRAIPACRC